MLEMLLPEYAKQLLENYQSIYSQLVSQLRWLYFDDSFRLVTRVGYLDDGWIRVRVDSGSALDINLVEVLREMSWTFYNIVEANSVLYKLIKFNRAVTPTWIYGPEVVAPAAGTALVSKTVSAGKTGYVYGIFISAGEANDFKLVWTSGGVQYSTRIPFPGKGAVQVVFDVPINEGLGADAGSTISLVNVNAGSAGVVYQAGVLYAEL